MVVVLFLCGVQLVLMSGVLTVLDLTYLCEKVIAVKSLPMGSGTGARDMSIYLFIYFSFH